MKPHYESMSGLLYSKVLLLASKTGHVRRAALVLNSLTRNSEVLHTFDNGRRFTVFLHEVYWAGLMVGFPYEPEVAGVLEKAHLVNPTAAFLDAGANLGYWSVAYCDRFETLAVEAVPTTYERLRRHGEASGFSSVHRAVWSTDGENVVVRWSDGRNEAASVVQGIGESRADVPTATIDSLCARWGGDRPLIVKLDVEGAEAQAVAGATEVLPRVLWIYEDHGHDSAHTASRALVDAGLDIYSLTSDGRAKQVHVDELHLIKLKSYRGYNFVAAHGSGPWASWLSQGF